MPVFPTVKGLHLGRGWREGCGLQLCGRSRCTRAPLHGYMASPSGGHHGMVVWPVPGKLGCVLPALVLWGVSLKRMHGRSVQMGPDRYIPMHPLVSPHLFVHTNRPWDVKYTYVHRITYK